MNGSIQVREAHFILPLLLWKDPRVRHRSQDDLQTEQELCDQTCLHAQVGMVKQANTEAGSFATRTSTVAPNAGHTAAPAYVALALIGFQPR